MSAEFGREWNAARKAQGFQSQDHLDAFYAHFDHQQSCAECQRPAASVWVDDGWQPTRNVCATGLRLRAASDSFR